MPDGESTSFFTRQVSKINYWKLAIWKLFSGVQIVIIATLVPMLQIQNWSEMDGQSKLILILCVYLAALKYVEGFLDQTMTILREKQNQNQNK